MATIHEALRIALAHQQAGRLPAAADIYRQILAVDPQNVDALHLSGLIEQREGRLDEARRRIERAVALKPDAPSFHSNLGLVLRAQGEPEAALREFQTAVRLRPDYVEGLCNLGLAHQDARQFDEALACYDRALRLNPRAVEALVNRGIIRQARRQREEALADYRQALEINPRYAIGHLNLGTLLRELRRSEEALAAYDRAIELDPNYATAWSNRGTLLGELHRPDEARQSYQQAIRCQPTYAKYHYNLANLEKQYFRRDEAEGHYRRAIELQPDLANAWTNLGTLCQELGRLEEAEACFERGMRLAPDDPLPVSNRLMNRTYQSSRLNDLHPLLDHWEQAFAAPHRAAWRPHDNPRDPDKRLNVGFVSADMGRHPIGLLMTHVLAGLRQGKIDTFIYSHRLPSDSITSRLRELAGVWHDVFDWTDDQLADQIRNDRIDLLVDLSGHTAGNRLPVFARKPAPVQITWMGYAGSTGMSAIDFLLTDRHLVPTELAHHYRERVWHLPLSGACFDLPADSPDVGPLPCASTDGTFTFGCFNNPTKITPAVLDAWGAILARVPSARLLLKYQGWHEPALSSPFRAAFQSRGVDPQRIEFQDMSPLVNMLGEYRRVDLALDPFPYTGGTSTLLALWMGVPVVSLVGETLASRQSLTLLEACGLGELATPDPAAYVERAVTLANDPNRLAAWRSELRERLGSTAFCDPRQFIPTLEPALRGMWRTWCEGQGD